MEKYPFYTAEDFIQDERFRAWMLSGGSEGDGFWQDFQQRHPERQAVLAAAQALFRALHDVQSFPTEEQGRRLWAGIEKETQNQLLSENWDDAWAEAHSPSSVRPLWKWFSVAATTLLVVGLGWVALRETSREPATPAGQQFESPLSLEEKINDSDQPQRISLSDGSRVVLYPGSRIRYANPFGQKERRVFLSGKGSFEVVKASTRPFVVFSEQLVAQVVGTSFTVDAFAGGTSSRVEVKTGKVKVFTLKKYRDPEQGKPEEMVLLTANQQVRYDMAKNSFDVGYVSRPALIKAPVAHPDFYFKNVAVADVFTTIEEAYGVKIEFDEIRLEGCRITVPLGNEPLFRKLDIVCQTIGATYEVWGTRIVVSGQGCP